MRRGLLDALLEARSGAVTAVLATSLQSGAQALLFPFDDGAEPVGDDGFEVDDGLRAAAREAAQRDASGIWEGAATPVFLRVYAPPPRLVMVGAVHVAQPLAAMARAAGLDVAVVDPRQAFATQDRFPGVRLVRQWPAEGLEALAPDRRTAVVTLSHDPKLDDPALQAALRGPAFYVGALGSRRTHGRRLQRLREAGLGDDELARIHGPVGLDVGARTPGEIAVSILAEVVATLRGVAS